MGTAQVPAARYGKAAGADLQMGARQSFSHTQLLALYFPTMLLADKERRRAAALAGGTAITPVGLPSIAAPDEGLGRAGLSTSLPARHTQLQLAPSRAAEAARPRGEGLTVCIEC